MRPLRLLTPVALLALAASPLLADWTSERKAFGDAYRSREASVRLSAVRNLREFDHPEGARLLLSSFAFEKDDGVLAELASKICDLGSPEAREALSRGVLGESDAGRRAKLCRIFAGGRGLDRVEILKKLLADRDPGVRSGAAAVLSTPDALLTRFVATLVTDPVPAVRREAIEALGRIATLEAVEPLIVCVENEAAEDLKAAAVKALKRITDRNYGANPEAWREWWRKHRAQDATQVDRAITLGGEYLRSELKIALDKGKKDPREAILAWERTRGIPVMTYALIHSGVDRGDEVFKAGVDHIVTTQPDGTYNAAVMALALADLDPVKYRGRLAQLAQILADAQCANGQWSYAVGNAPSRSTSGKAPEEPDEESGSDGGRKKAPPPKIPIKWNGGARSPSGDNSNTQFAILGLRATMDAGCELPKQLWERSLDWYMKAQEQPYGGWGYTMGGAYWAMTCSAVSSITICLHALGKDEEFRDGRPLDVALVKNGVDWLDANWMDAHGRFGQRGGGGWGFFYDLYSIERVGMIVGLEKVGDHDWYAEGSNKLLECQEKNGAWGGNGIDTAFAILFLRRATRGYEVSPQDGK